MTASKTAQMAGTRPDAVSLSLEDTVVDKKKGLSFIASQNVKDMNLVLHSDYFCVHVCTYV